MILNDNDANHEKLKGNDNFGFDDDDDKDNGEGARKVKNFQL